MRISMVASTICLDQAPAGLAVYGRRKSKV